MEKMMDGKQSRPASFSSDDKTSDKSKENPTLHRELTALSKHGIGADTFKNTMRQWAAGVTVITVGKPPHCHGMTASSFTPLSCDPPLILICINRQNDTHALLSIGTQFGINLLSESQIALSQHFARKTPERGSFDDLPWYVSPHDVTLFQSCVAVMEAVVEQVYNGGDHTIFVGRVLSAHSDADCSALVYSRGGYAKLNWANAG